MKNIKIGDTASFSKTISESDVYNFAGICGDFNPVHINETKAAQSRFGKRVCHGMLVASFISTVLGMYLPGNGTIYLEQSLKFKKPVYICDTVLAEVKVLEINNNIITLQTVVTNQSDDIVLEGTAKVMVS